MYLDAGSNGQRFDYDTEVALGYSAGFETGPINPGHRCRAARDGGGLGATARHSSWR